MRKLKRFLSLFLASSLLMGLNVQAMPVEKTDTDIAKLEIEVNGEGKVTIDDGYSKYFLENKDVFRADCTVDTNLKITATPNEGYYIASVDGIDSNGISDGNSKIYDVNLQENKTSITINFLEEKKEEINNEINQSNTNEEESKENAPLDFNQEPIKEQSDDENQNLEEEIRPVDDTQIGDTIPEDSVNDENVNEDTTTSEEKQVSDDTNTNSSTMGSEIITN